MPVTDRLPFLRRSFWRFAVGLPSVIRNGQVGDGREAETVRYVLANAKPGDVTDAIAAIDRFARQKSFLMNVGDEKGLLLDAAVRRSKARLALELGAYCGYSGLRIARAALQARVYSVEMSAANADNARRIWEHAGVADRITCIVGTIGDGGRTLDALADNGFDAGALDFLFVDHNKDAYLTDLLSIENRGWLHPGSVVVADNVLLPGAPKYRAYMRRHQGGLWDTVEHKTHAEYTRIPDLVLESTYRG
jgi:catechol O-methyltransferase